ncbi:hypothetical protein G5C01_06410 [Moraxella bovoculi]|uniref:hypothetical protein n=1 Tax=Moraxella bovoculi TaxID=386891 RepID=UPI001C2DAB67|nr:hypothetical protein [Moraxella bovoculi]NSM10987.1 hypothetical protein [Moraxella bovoculi]
MSAKLFPPPAKLFNHDGETPQSLIDKGVECVWCSRGCAGFYGIWGKLSNNLAKLSKWVESF